jgi:sulfatase modifying factor 1
MVALQQRVGESATNVNPCCALFAQCVQASYRINYSLAVVLLLLCCACSSAQAAKKQEAPPQFVFVEGGEFTMGSPATELNRAADEVPHRVRLNDFYISRYEVTVAEFRQFVEATGYVTDAEKNAVVPLFLQAWLPRKTNLNWRYSVSGRQRRISEDYHPVFLVSWNDAVAYCRWLSKKTGRHYRLPTEAEWEYACRAGTTTAFSAGYNITTDEANYDGNYPYAYNRKGVYRGNTVPVDGFAANSWGLYNMSGNVAEWCSDWYSDSYYQTCNQLGVVTNPTGPSEGTNRVIRGGSWNDDARYCRSADRNDSMPDYRYINVGFRVVLEP